MAQHIHFREIERNWRIKEQGVALLNCIPNSTLVSGNLLEVVNVHLDNTTLISNTAENYHEYLVGLVAQSEEATQ